MSSMDIFEAISQLSSNKVRERTESLDEIEHTLDQHSLPHKELSKLCEALLTFIDEEKATYKQNKVPSLPSLKRLELGNRTLRTLVLTQRASLRAKTVNMVFEFITTRFFDNSGKIFEPLALDFSRSLHILLSYEEHRYRVLNNSWVSVVDVIIKALSLQLTVNSTATFVSELLDSLTLLLKETPITFIRVSSRLADMLCLYFNNMDNESQATQSLLEVANHSLIMMSTTDIYSGFRVVSSIVKSVSKLNDTRREALKDNMIIFGILASEYITSNVYMQVDSEGPSSVFGDDFKENLLRWLDLILQKLMTDHSISLNMDMIQFPTNYPGQKSWFSFQSLAPADTKSMKPWLRLFQCTCLLNSFFNLDRDGNAGVMQLLKKRRINYESFSNLLDQCDTSIDVILQLISRADLSIQRSGLKLLVFHLHTFPVDYESISFEKINYLYSQVPLKPWVSLCFKTLLDYGWKFSNDQLCQLLKVNITMVKEPGNVSIASQTAIKILSIPSFSPTDKYLTQLIASIFDNPVVNGPAEENNDSLKFWVLFSGLGKDFKVNKKYVGDLIIDWVNSKWVTVKETDDLSCLPSFVCWLSGWDFEYSERITPIDNIFTRFYSKWKSVRKLAQSIFRTKGFIPQISTHIDWKSPPPALDPTSLDTLLENLLQKLEYFGDTGKAVPLSRFITYCHYIYQRIHHITQLSTSSERMKYGIQHSLDIISPKTSKERFEVISLLGELNVIDLSGDFVCDFDKVKDLLAPNSETLGEESGQSSIDFGEFGEVRRASERNTVDDSLVYSYLEYQEVVEQRSVMLILSINKQSIEAYSNVSTEKALQYMRTLPPRPFIYCLHTLLNYFDASKASTFHTSHVEELLKQFGSKVLQDKDSNFKIAPVSVSLFSRLTGIVAKTVVTKDLEGDLMETFIDIFNWFKEFVSTNTLVEELALASFLSVTVILLKHLELHKIDESSSMFDMISASLGSASNFVKVYVSDSTQVYVDSLSWNRKMEFLQDYIGYFHDCETSAESSASLLKSLVNLSASGYPFFMKTLSVVLMKYNFPYFQLYAHDSIQSLLATFEIHHLRKLPIVQLLELFTFWFGERGDFSGFPYGLFGFNTFPEFVAANSSLLFAVIRSKKNVNFEAIPALIGSDDDFVTLEYHAVAFTVPLSFTEHGVRSNIYTQLLDSYGDETIVYDHSIGIVRWFIMIADVSKESDFIKHIPGISTLPYLKDLVRADTTDIYPPLFLMLKFSDALKEITKIASSSKDFWSPSNVLFLCDYLFLALRTSFGSEAKTLVLRRLKFLLIIGKNAFKSEDVLNQFVGSLWPLLCDNELHQDASILITVAVEIYPENILKSKLYPNHLIDVFYGYATFVDRGNGTLSNLSRGLLTDIYHSIGDNRNTKDIFRALYDILSSANNSLPLESLQQILTYASQQTSAQFISSIVSSLALIFVRNPSLQDIPLAFKPSKQVAEFLLTVCKTHPSKEFYGFAGKYLGRFYTGTGDPLKSKTEELPRSFEYKVEESTHSFDFIFAELIKSRDEVDPSENRVMINHVLGFALFQFTENPSKVKKIIDFELILAQFSGTIKPLDPTTFNLLHSRGTECTDDIASMTNLIGLPLLEWSQRLCLVLLSELKSLNPLVPPLLKYFSVYPGTICCRILGNLFLVYVRSFGTSGEVKVVTSFVNDTLKSYLDPVSRDEGKLKLVLNLCQLIRCCCNAGERVSRLFQKIYQRLDHQTIYLAAFDLGLFKFSLLEFEELHCSPRGSDDVLKAQLNVITQIYEGLDDIDLLYGLPVQPSLEYAIKLLNTTEVDPWKQIMFNSASLDSAILTGSDPSFSTHQLLQSLSANNLYGLSRIVNRDLSFSDQSREFLNWSLNLNQWNHTAPLNPSTEAETIYKILKTVKEQDSLQVIQDTCNDCIERVLKGENERFETLKVLSVIYNIKNAVSSSVYSLVKDHSEFISTTEDWFTVSPLSQFDDVLLSRKIAFQARYERTGDDKLLISFFLELARLGKCARSKADHQKALNVGAELARIERLYQGDSNVKSFLSRISRFESANNLWMQGDSDISIAILNDLLSQSMSPPNEPGAWSQLPDSIVHSHLVKWNSESKHKEFQDILEDHVEPAVSNMIDEIMSTEMRSDIYHEVAYFCYQQLKSYGFKEKIELQMTKIESFDHQQVELRKIIESQPDSSLARKDAKRHLQRIKYQKKSAQSIYDVLVENRSVCIEKAIEFFSKSIAISHQHDEEDVDKLCALWLEFRLQGDVDQVVDREIPHIPVHKLIPWVQQLCSHISNTKTRFQSTLQGVLVDMLIKHPYHIMYHVLNIIMLEKFKEPDDSALSRIAAARSIWRFFSESDHTSSLHNAELAEQVLKLAMDKSKPTDRRIRLDKLNVGKFWLEALPSYRVPLPTQFIPVSLGCDYSSLPTICNVNRTIVISATGISAPRIISMTLTDGSRPSMLVKGGSDDLRQDAIMEQVFEKVNKIFDFDKESRKRKLSVRTYKVVPLGLNAGMIEFVVGSSALAELLAPLHMNDDISYNDARHQMGEVEKKSSQTRINVYKKLMAGIKPVFRKFFIETFLNVDDWFDTRRSYTRGLAASSIVGYILGLGDRHLSNILIDTKTGEPVHIDLGVAFDQGKVLPIPETVPFRLTRDLVDGLGISGVKGSFEKSAENTYRVLRLNTERIIGVLNVLRHDPLYAWTLTPLKKKKLQSSKKSLKEDNEPGNPQDDSGDEDSFVELGEAPTVVDDAEIAVDGVRDKLLGNGLSVEATVRELIRQATDPENLALIFRGWSPFY